MVELVAGLLLFKAMHLHMRITLIEPCRLCSNLVTLLTICTRTSLNATRTSGGVLIHCFGAISKGAHPANNGWLRLLSRTTCG